MDELSADVRANVVNECRLLNDLSQRQKRLCEQNMELMKFVLQGAWMALEECGRLFASNTNGWKCNLLGNSSRRRVGRKGKPLVVEESTRESAFLHALLSASVSYQITKACSAGNLSVCGCDKTVHLADGQKMDFLWTGE